MYRDRINTLIPDTMMFTNSFKEGIPDLLFIIGTAKVFKIQHEQMMSF